MDSSRLVELTVWIAQCANTPAASSQPSVFAARRTLRFGPLVSFMVEANITLEISHSHALPWPTSLSSTPTMTWPQINYSELQALGLKNMTGFEGVGIDVALCVRME